MSAGKIARVMEIDRNRRDRRMRSRARRRERARRSLAAKMNITMMSRVNHGPELTDRHYHGGHDLDTFSRQQIAHRH